MNNVSSVETEVEEREAERENFSGEPRTGPLGAGIEAKGPPKS